MFSFPNTENLIILSEKSVNNMTKFCIELLKKIGFSEEDRKYLYDFSERMKDNKEYIKLLSEFSEYTEKGEEIYEKLPAVAQKEGVNFYTLSLLFFVEAAEAAYPRYLALGLSEDYFYNNMKDLKVKNDECKTLNNVIGTHSVMEWFIRFYIPNRFRLGRLVYETAPFRAEAYEKDGISLKKNDVVITIHIPSGEPLIIDDVLESFKMAYDFFKDLRINGKLPVACRSWLLYEKHREFLSPESNIRKFMDCFDIIDTTIQEHFPNMWRIFNVETVSDYNELSEDTSLQRAYKKWLLEGNKAGASYGIRILEGE